MTQGAQGQAAANASLPAATWQPTKMRAWYEGIATLQLAGVATAKEIGQRLGRSPVTIGLIIRSDLYKEYYAQRREERDKLVNEKIADGLTKVASVGLDILADELETKRAKVGIENVQSITESALDRLGFAPSKQGSSVNVNVTQQNNTVVASVTKDELERARGNMVRSQEELGRKQAPMLDLSVTHKAPDERFGEAVQSVERGGTSFVGKDVEEL